MGNDAPFAIIGKPLPKIDAAAKCLGRTKFADDIVLPRMLAAKILRSPHPHARIVSIDTSRAGGHHRARCSHRLRHPPGEPGRTRP